MLERVKTDGAEPVALVSLNTSEVRIMIRALEAHADASLALVKMGGDADQRLEFAWAYDAAKCMAERLKRLGI